MNLTQMQAWPLNAYPASDSPYPYQGRYRSFHSFLLEREERHHERIGMSTAKRVAIEPHENDVLMGRGGKNNQHSGNEKLRQFARVECDNYRQSTKKGKSQISRHLVHQMRQLIPPARFLKKNNDTGEWDEVGDDVAREKASQVLRDAVAGLLGTKSTDSDDEDDIEVVAAPERPSSNLPRDQLAEPTTPINTSVGHHLNSRGYPSISHSAASRYHERRTSLEENRPLSVPLDLYPSTAFEHTPILTSSSSSPPPSSNIYRHERKRQRLYSAQDPAPSYGGLTSSIPEYQRPPREPDFYPQRVRSEEIHERPSRPYETIHMNTRSSYTAEQSTRLAYTYEQPVRLTHAYEQPSHTSYASEPPHRSSYPQIRHSTAEQNLENRPPVISNRQGSTASAQSLLGDVGSGLNEFDLFNGELLESDQEEEEKEDVTWPNPVP